MTRVLLDENLPRLLKRDLSELAVHTVSEMGWAGVKNGELLLRAAAEFDVFLTADRNLPHQHTLSVLDLGVVLLTARSTKLEDLRPLRCMANSVPATVVADLPDLKHCSAFGTTPDEAVREVQIAKAAWLDAARESGARGPPCAHPWRGR